MFISSQINENFGVSVIKKNNKVSLHLAQKTENSIFLIKKIDNEFPFSNPLVTNNSVRMFEFFVEANNLYKRNIEFLQEIKNFKD